MILINGVVRGVPAAKRSDINKMLTNEWRDMGNTWHKKYRLTHFSMRAYSKYGYTARKKSYNFRKKKAVGHVIPLLLSGEGRMLSGTKNVKANKKGCDVTMPINKFNFRSKGSRVNMRKEMTTVAGVERDDLNKRAERGMARQLNAFKKQYTF